jgi:hypothetical protein
MNFVYPLKIPQEKEPSFLTSLNIFKTDAIDDCKYVLDHIKNDLTKSIGSTIYVPIGTKLYYGSNNFEVDFTKNRIMFFGLDVVHALWHVVELQSYHMYRLGKVYECVVTKPIPVVILANIYYDVNRSSPNYNKGLLYPKIVHHGRDIENEFPCDISAELAINSGYFKHHFRLEHTYTIDTSVLAAFADRPLKKFNPVVSILEIEMKVYKQNINNAE